ncbi:uncharacterized protein A4U43_C07F37930 [Asparagus officinalis]|uniref:Peptidase M50 domain-containing protein n=1 Tax=Asparagus officinalis TaxID=4686 RepID=A0A5P1EHV4_ASPOF|nr:uncharacterized protein A4U43_C07F37930 [Asparagus officinalis]
MRPTPSPHLGLLAVKNPLDRGVAASAAVRPFESPPPATASSRGDSASKVSGPVAIIARWGGGGEARARMGCFSLPAVINLNLAVINLLPVAEQLDGGCAGLCCSWSGEGREEDTEGGGAEDNVVGDIGGVDFGGVFDCEGYFES